MSGRAPLGSGTMFDAIASRYDAMNRVLSLGLDQGWRRKAVAALELSEGARVLDLAAGTGDLTIAIQRAHPSAQVVGIDPSAGMLEVAARKAQRAKLAIDFRVGDACGLDVDDASVDGVSMAFGIRNVVDRPKALREIARVLRPSGRAVVLELLEPPPGPLGVFARAYVHGVVPQIGALFAGKREYAHLARSIAAFPPKEIFAETMREAGLEILAVEALTFGVACLFVGAAPAPRGKEA